MRALAAQGCGLTGRGRHGLWEAALYVLHVFSVVFSSGRKVCAGRTWGEQSSSWFGCSSPMASLT